MFASVCSSRTRASVQRRCVQERRRGVRAEAATPSEDLRETTLERIKVLENDKARVDQQIEVLREESIALQRRIDDLHGSLGVPPENATPVPVVLEYPDAIDAGLHAMLRDAARTGLSELREGEYLGEIEEQDGKATAGHGAEADWATAAVVQRHARGADMLASVAVLLPHDPSDPPPALVWGLSPGAAAAWEEPPAGWRTVPDRSFDVARGAWGTPCRVFDTTRSVGGSVRVYRAVLRVPVQPPLTRARGIAFKFQVASKWYGDVSTGRNLVLPAPTLPAPVAVEGGQQPGGGAGVESDRSDRASLLVALTRDERRALSGTRARQRARAPAPRAVALDCADNPFRDTSAALPLRADGEHSLVNTIAGTEHKARRSLMHRFNSAFELFADIDLPDASAVTDAVASLRQASLQIAPAHAEEVELRNRPGRSAGDPSLQHAAGAEAHVLTLALWLRFSAARLLTWNHNYNVKPREISRAQARLTEALAGAWSAHAWVRHALGLALSSVGRGGNGDMGQRIRDEILAIQKRNHCKGGMMEQWHQKLHNNSSPDDIEICRALLAYIDSDLDISKYWESLSAAGIDAARLASYDRAITAEPSFGETQCPGLRRDLEAYMVTLSAVHGGDDLHAAALAALGYEQAACKGKAISHEGVPDFATPRIRCVIQAILVQSSPHNGGEIDREEGTPPGGTTIQSEAAEPAVQSVTNTVQPVAAAAEITADELESDETTLDVTSETTSALGKLERLLGLLVEARTYCHEFLEGKQGRLDPCHVRDIIYLDIALAGTFRNMLEAGLDEVQKVTAALRGLPPSDAMRERCDDVAVLAAVAAHTARNAAVGGDDTAHAIAGAADLDSAASALGRTGVTSFEAQWATHVAHAAMLRLGYTAPASATRWLQALTSVGEPLAAALGIDDNAARAAMEDSVRGEPVALLAALQELVLPALAHALDLSPWCVVAAGRGGGASGRLRLAADIAAFQDGGALDEPTVLLVDQVDPDHDLPPSCSALLCRSSINALSHFALRARACGAFVASCSDADAMRSVAALDGERVTARLSGTTVVVEATTGDGAAGDVGDANEPTTVPTSPDVEAIRDAIATDESALEAASGRWIVREGEYDEASVGPKALNVQHLRATLPRSVLTPPSCALPFDVLAAVVRHPSNLDQRGAIEHAAHSDSAEAAAACASSITHLELPADLENALLEALDEPAFRLMQDSPPDASDAQPTDVGAAWRAIRIVWASAWHGGALRAYRLLSLPLSVAATGMSVLLQPLVDAHMAFVSHTLDPRPRASGAGAPAGQMYVEAVFGLGESLVANATGSAIAFTCDSSALHDALLGHKGAASALGLRCLGADAGATADVTIAGWLRELDDSVIMDLTASCVHVCSWTSKAWIVSPSRQGHSESGMPRATRLIARSASKLEDLPGFSGAGVFDSVPVGGAEHMPAPGCTPLPEMARHMLAMALASMEVGAAFGAPQDVEGAVDGAGDVFLVQARPQVL